MKLKLSLVEARAEANLLRIQMQVCPIIWQLAIDSKFCQFEKKSIQLIRLLRTLITKQYVYEQRMNLLFI